MKRVMGVWSGSRGWLAGLCWLGFSVGAVGSSAADDWARFRGPDGQGISREAAAFPTQWSPNANVAWKLELPGSGVSSPIVVGSKVFVTCYSGYGLSRENPGEMKDLVRHLVCCDLETGKKLWQRDVPANTPEDPFTGAGVPAHGYASHTPVSDGERVYAFFGKSGVFAFDLEGNQQWQTAVGTEADPWAWGSSASPIVHEGIVIVVASAESQSLVGLDKATGREVWRQEAAMLDGTWSTPTVVNRAEGTPELVLGTPKEIWGLDPATGQLRWFAAVSGAEQANSSPVVHEGTVYGFTGRGGGSAAVKLGGQGDVTESNVVWTGRDTDRFGSPVFYQGRLYLVANGMVNVIDPQSGERIEQIRLEGAVRGGGGMMGNLDYASPIIAGGHMYYVNGSGQVFVFRLGEGLEQIATNRLTTEKETFGGSPAASGGRLLFRSNRHLYCVGDLGQTVNEADNRVAEAPAEEGPPGGGRGGFGGGRGPGQGGGGPGGRPGGGQRGGPGGGRPGGQEREDNRPNRPARPGMVIAT